MIRGFTAAHVPSLQGQIHVVTGANTGIGLETARVLASRGARVLLCCRTAEKAQAAMDDIQRDAPEADLDGVVLELGDLTSVRAAAERIAREPHLDVLVASAAAHDEALARRLWDVSVSLTGVDPGL